MCAAGLLRQAQYFGRYLAKGAGDIRGMLGIDIEACGIVAVVNWAASIVGDTFQEDAIGRERHSGVAQANGIDNYAVQAAAICRICGSDADTAGSVVGSVGSHGNTVAVIADVEIAPVGVRLPIACIYEIIAENIQGGDATEVTDGL